MGILDRMERGLDRAVNGAFAKTFRSGLQPIEIASALRRELDTRAAIVSRDRTLAPNRFTVRVSAVDEQRMRDLGSSLNDELVQSLQRHADEQGFSFAGPLTVKITADPSLTAGMIVVDSGTVRGDQVTWEAVLEVDGVRHRLRSRTIVGRGSEADVTIGDSGASRKHLEVVWDGRHAQARDLGSTNGTRIDGERITVADLKPGSVISIGRTNLVFRVVPREDAEADDTFPWERPQ